MMLTCGQIHFLISKEASCDGEKLENEPALDTKRKLFKTEKKRV